MDRNRLYKEQYDFEWSHRSYLLGMTNFCMIAAIIVGTTMVAEAQSFNYEAGFATALAFVSGLTGSFAFLSTAVFCICMALVGREYRHLPTLAQLEDYYSETKQRRKDNGATDESHDAEFERFLNGRIIEATDANSNTNKEREYFVQKAIVSIISSLPFLMVSSIAYVLSKINLA